MTLGILQRPYLFSFSLAPYSQEVTPALCAISDTNHLTDRCLAPPTLLLHIFGATLHKQFCSRGRVTTLGAEADLEPWFYRTPISIPASVVLEAPSPALSAHHGGN